MTNPRTFTNLVVEVGHVRLHCDGKTNGKDVFLASCRDGNDEMPIGGLIYNLAREAVAENLKEYR